MGKSYSKGDDSDFRLDLNDWEEVSQNQMQPNNRLGIDQPVTLRNRISGQLVDAYYPTFLSQKQYDEYRKNLDFRRTQPNIVRALYYKPNIRKQFCSTSYAMTVFIEHVRGRLSQYKDIPLKDSLYCMIAMLDGYKKLFNEVGRFYISEDQVIIDEQGEVRVWLNSDFSKDTPEQSDSRWSKWDGSEYDMVEDIISIIIENTDEADGPRLKFSDFYQRQKMKYGNKVGFEQAKHIIYDYCKASGIEMQRIFESVLEIYQQNGDVQMLNQNQFGINGSSDVRNFQQYPFDSQERQSTHNNNYQEYNPNQHPLPLNPLGSGLYSNAQNQINEHTNSQRQFHNHLKQHQQNTNYQPSYLNSREASTQNFFTHQAYPRTGPIIKTLPQYPIATNPQIVISQPPIYRQPPPQMYQAPIYQKPPLMQFKPTPNLTPFNPSFQGSNTQVRNFTNGPVKIQINGQNIIQSQQHSQNRNQVIAVPQQKVWAHKEKQPQIKQQVNETEIIRQLDEFHRQVSNQYSSQKQYEGEPNEILDQAIEEDIQRQIGIGDQEEDYDGEDFYDHARNSYGHEQYYSNDRNHESNNSREEVYINQSQQKVIIDSSHRNSIQNNSVHVNSVHNNSIHNNSIHNNSIHNNSIHNNSIHNNSIHNNSIHNNSIQNSSHHQNSGMMSNNSAFRQSSGQVQQNAYWQNNYSIPPIPNRSSKGEVENSRKYARKQKEIYYTLNNEMELDPEIAADLAMLG